MSSASPPPPAEDTRVWVGRVAEGRDAEHRAFLDWLRSGEAEEVFRRRRLTEYRLVEEAGQVRVLFRAPRTGDPRIMIDFLRYPGLWPEYWQFERSGQPADAAQIDTAGPDETRVHWRRAVGEG